MPKLKLQYFGHLMQRADSLEKTLMLGKIGGMEKKGTTEEERVVWHHYMDDDGHELKLNGHEFEQGLGVGNGQGSLACCSPRGCKESHMTERMT